MDKHLLLNDRKDQSEQYYYSQAQYRLFQGTVVADDLDGAIEPILEISSRNCCCIVEKSSQGNKYDDEEERLNSGVPHENEDEDENDNDDYWHHYCY